MLDKVTELYASFFRNDPEDEDDEFDVRLENARKVLEWASQEYYERFISWLDGEASKPINAVSGHADLIQSAVRANTLREVRQYLSRLTSEAEAAIQQSREGR